MLKSGGKRYWNNLIKSREQGNETRAAYGQAILRHVIPAYLDELDDFKEDLNTKCRNPSNFNYYRLFHSLPTPILAYLGSKIIVDGLSKAMSLNAISLAIGRRLEDEVRWNFLGKQEPELFKGVMHYNRLYGNSYEYCREGFMGAVRKVTNLEWRLFPTGERASVGYILLELFRRSTGLIEYTYLFQEGLRGSHGAARKKLYVTPTDKTLDWIKDYNSSKEFMKPLYLPTVEQPIKWTDYNKGGYDLPKFFLVKSRYSGDSASIQTCMDSASIAQSTEFKVNETVYNVANRLWELGVGIGDLAESFAEDLPPKPFDMDKNDESRKVWRKQAGAVYKRNYLNQSKRFVSSRLLHLSRRFKNQSIWFPCQLDFRSRMYYSPSFLNPQGNDLARGLLEFAEPCKLDNDEAEKWFLIHGANLMGQDKKPYNERLDYVKKEHDRIIAIAEEPLELLEEWEDEGEPFKFLAWANEYSHWCADPSSFVSRIPIHLDATNNGLQILSLLSGDSVSARRTNVIPSRSVRDIYQDVADLIHNKMFNEDDPLLVQYADKWIDLGVTRKLVKNSVMIVPYSGTYHAFSKNFMDFLNAQTVDHFQDKVKACNYMASVFVDVMGGMIDKPLELMNWFKDVADEFTSENIPMMWSTPTGFSVLQGYPKTALRHIKSRIGESCKWIRFVSDLEEKDGRKMRNAISANIVHSLDASVMHLSVLDGHRAGIRNFSLIHDSFGIPANSVNLFQSILKNQIFSIFSLDLLEGFRKSWEIQLGKDIPQFQTGSLNLSQVKDSEYFFC